MARRKVEIQITAKDRASKTLKALATGAIAGIGVAAGLAAKQLAFTLGRELVRVAQLVIEIGAGFEKSMAGVKAITRGTASEMASLEKVARNLGKSTVFTANQAAQAMEQFSLAGFSVNETLRATGPALDLAAAGQLSMAEAADITSNVLRQFNIDASETTRVVDVLAGTATTSNQTVRDMGEAMKFAGITADALGVSLEETAALLGKLADRGLKASLGGTALRRAFAVFLGQLEPGEAGLKGFNAALARNEDGSFSFAKALNQLRDSGITAGDVMKAFGQRAGPGMVALLGLGGDVIRDYTDEIASMGGVAKQVADDRLDNLTSDMKLLTSAMSESAIIISKELIPALRSLVTTATTLVGILNTLSERGGHVNRKFQDMTIVFQVLAIRKLQAARAGLLFLKVIDPLPARISPATAAIAALNSAIQDLQSTFGKGIGASFARKFPVPVGSDGGGGEPAAPGGGLPVGGGGASPPPNLPQNRVKGFLEFQGPQQFLDPSDEAQGPPIELFLDAEKRKQEAIRATAQALIESKLLIAETEEEAIAIQVELEVLAFEEEKERIAGNDEALENLEESHQNKMDALKKRTADNEKRRQEEEARRLKAFRKATVDQALATATAIFGNNKALSIASAIINTARGVTGALAFTPWTPLNFVMAALVAAAGVAEIATIKSAKFAHGGLVTGGVPGLDSVPALLTPGERVLTVAQTRELDRIGAGPAGIAGNGRGGGVFPPGASGGGGLTIAGDLNITIGGDDAGANLGDLDADTARNLLDVLNDVVLQSGGELVASSILKNGRPTVAEDL